MKTLSKSKVVLISQLAPNQTVVTTEEGMFLQSYSSVVAFKPNSGDSPTVAPDYDYSATTLKYVKQFLGLNSYSKKEIAKMVQSGSIILSTSLA